MRIAVSMPWPTFQIGAKAEAYDAYREAIAALEQTSMKMLHARAQLVYGEWLRRSNRRADSRGELGAV